MQYDVKATVYIVVEAETSGDARKAAFDLIASAKSVSKRGRNAGSVPKASVASVTIDSNAQFAVNSGPTDSADAMEMK